MDQPAPEELLGVEGLKPAFTQAEYETFHAQFVADVAPIQKEHDRRRALSEQASMHRTVR